MCADFKSNQRTTIAFDSSRLFSPRDRELTLMGDAIWLQYEPIVRAVAFLSMLAIMGIAERRWPVLPDIRPRMVRWRTNMTLAAFGTLSARTLGLLPVPIAAAAGAHWADLNGIGLFNVLNLPPWTAMIGAILFLDFAIWLQHWAFHKFGIFWRLHQIHHADRNIDVSTALRFHPIEIAISALLKSVAAIIIGAPIAAIIVFEILLNACAIFNHANTALPQSLERFVRPIIITPDLHRIHHSVLKEEHNSNYGFCLTIWDRLFGTLRQYRNAGSQPAQIGLPKILNKLPERLTWTLAAPFSDPRRASDSN